MFFHEPLHAYAFYGFFALPLFRTLPFLLAPPHTQQRVARALEHISASAVSRRLTRSQSSRNPRSSKRNFFKDHPRDSRSKISNLSEITGAFVLEKQKNKKTHGTRLTLNRGQSRVAILQIGHFATRMQPPRRNSPVFHNSFKRGAAQLAAKRARCFSRNLFFHAPLVRPSIYLIVQAAGSIKSECVFEFGDEEYMCGACLRVYLYIPRVETLGQTSRGSPRAKPTNSNVFALH